MSQRLRHKTKKCKSPGRKHEGKLHDIVFSDFVDVTSKAQPTTENKTGGTTSNLKASVQQRKQLRVKRKSKEWEKIFAKPNK